MSSPLRGRPDMYGTTGPQGLPVAGGRETGQPTQLHVNRIYIYICLVAPRRYLLMAVALHVL